MTDRDADSQFGIAGAPAIKVGTVSTFYPAKLTNHSAAAAKDVLELYNAGSCEGVVFSTTVKTGTTDVSVVRCLPAPTRLRRSQPASH